MRQLIFIAAVIIILTLSCIAAMKEIAEQLPKNQYRYSLEYRTEEGK